MTELLVPVAALVALAAAVRSTWSPCGLSMLSTITPVSEGAKGHSYGSTATWFAVGATVGGASLGAATALGAAGVRALGPSPRALGLLAAGLALLAAASDTGVGGLRLPVHRRQVNERWLDHFRPWVYGAGFGWQIGAGVATYITTAAVYLTVVLAALTADPLAALIIGASFGLARGLAVFLTRSITSTSELLAFHRRLSAAAPRVRSMVVAVEIGGAAVLVAGVWLPAVLLAAVAATGAIVVTGAAVVATSRSRTGGEGTVAAGPTRQA